MRAVALPAALRTVIVTRSGNLRFRLSRRRFVRESFSRKVTLPLEGTRKLLRAAVKCPRRESSTLRRVLNSELPASRAPARNE